MREAARKAAVERELDRQRRVQGNVVVRVLVKEANESRREIESEIRLAEARERKEAVAKEEKRAREELERVRRAREEASREMREKRMLEERVKARQTEEKML